MKKPKTHRIEDDKSTRGTASRIVKDIERGEGIISAMGDAIRIVDRTFMVLYENQVHKNMMGDHTGEYCYKAYKKQEGVCSDCPVEPVFKDGRIHTVQKELQTDEGISYVEATASPLRDKTGKIIAGIEILRDITKRKQAEAAAIESERKLKDIIEHSKELYYTHDSRHVLTYVSPQSLKMLGYTPEEMMIEWTRLVTDNPINEKRLGITEEALRTGEKQDTYLLELYRKDGSKVLLEIDESPVKDSDGNVIGIVGAARDVTEHVKADDEIRRRIRELEEFYDMAVGRELRMKELKEENEELREALKKHEES